MEENEVLEKLHSLDLKLADELKRICEKYDISYFMIAGTLLGAIRDGGFIPWDDDMDFGILREDFEKFLLVCDQETDANIYYLQTDRKEKFYPFNYAKLSLIGTEFKEEFLNKKNIQQGIFIDIFPIDTVPDSPRKKWLQYKMFHVTNRLLRLKTGFVSKYQPRSLRHSIGRIFAPIFPIKFLKKVRHRCISRYSGTESRYVVTSDGSYGLEKETLNRKWVENRQNYTFEDKVYPGIADYDEYLTYFYGDYMTPPKEDDRGHHRRLEVDFGEYANE